jgi:hypothetical protein
MLFMEAESEEEVRKLVGELPLSELGDTAVTQFRSFEELRDAADKIVRRGLL